MPCTTYSTYLLGTNFGRLLLIRDLALECEIGLNNNGIFLGETHDILPTFPIPLKQIKHQFSSKSSTTSLDPTWKKSIRFCQPQG